jgi:hypothetical protein
LHQPSEPATVIKKSFISLYLTCVAQTQFGSRTFRRFTVGEPCSSNNDDSLYIISSSLFKWLSECSISNTKTPSALSAAATAEGYERELEQARRARREAAAAAVAVAANASDIIVAEPSPPSWLSLAPSSSPPYQMSNDGPHGPMFGPEYRIDPALLEEDRLAHANANGSTAIVPDAAPTLPDDSGANDGVEQDAELEPLRKKIKTTKGSKKTAGAKQAKASAKPAPKKKSKSSAPLVSTSSTRETRSRKNVSMYAYT